MTEDLLLDTCAIIWASQDDPIADDAREAINATAAHRGALRVSPMSAWEIGLLCARGRLVANRPPLRWFDSFVEAAGATVEPLTPAVMVGASYLPDLDHSDPVDRILISTAREAGLAIVTRDRVILNYAEAGHVRAIAC